MRWACAAVVAALGLAGCGRGASQHARVLHMASAGPLGVEHDPAVAFFIDRVAQLSGGLRSHRARRALGARRHGTPGGAPATSRTAGPISAGRTRAASTA